MSEFGGSLKSIVKKSIEALGNKASDLAAGAKQKVYHSRPHSVHCTVFDNDLAREQYPFC